MNLKKRTTIAILSCVAALAGTIGLTYAFFTATVTGNNNASSIIVKTASLSIEYTNGNELKATNILPGWTMSKTFTVKNTGDVTAYYKLDLANVTNTFTRKQDLQITVTSSATNCGAHTAVAFPAQATSGIVTGNATKGQTCTYTVKMDYLAPANTNQSADMNKQAMAKIVVTSTNA